MEDGSRVVVVDPKPKDGEWEVHVDSIINECTGSFTYHARASVQKDSHLPIRQINCETEFEKWATALADAEPLDRTLFPGDVGSGWLETKLPPLSSSGNSINSDGSISIVSTTDPVFLSDTTLEITKDALPRSDKRMQARVDDRLREPIRQTMERTRKMKKVVCYNKTSMLPNVITGHDASMGTEATLQTQIGSIPNEDSTAEWGGDKWATMKVRDEMMDSGVMPVPWESYPNPVMDELIKERVTADFDASFSIGFKTGEAYRAHFKDSVIPQDWVNLLARHIKHAGLSFAKPVFVDVHDAQRNVFYVLVYVNNHISGRGVGPCRSHAMRNAAYDALMTVDAHDKLFADGILPYCCRNAEHTADPMPFIAVPVTMESNVSCAPGTDILIETNEYTGPSHIASTEEPAVQPKHTAETNAEMAQLLLAVEEMNTVVKKMSDVEHATCVSSPSNVTSIQSNFVRSYSTGAFVSGLFTTEGSTVDDSSRNAIIAKEYKDDVAFSYLCGFGTVAKQKLHYERHGKHFKWEEILHAHIEHASISSHPPIYVHLLESDRMQKDMFYVMVYVHDRIRGKGIGSSAELAVRNGAYDALMKVDLDHGYFQNGNIPSCCKDWL